jgi:hypothetical protein
VERDFDMYLSLRLFPDQGIYLYFLSSNFKIKEGKPYIEMKNLIIITRIKKPLNLNPK